MSYDGSIDVARAADELAERLPDPLKPLAHAAFNLAWSWTPGGEDAFRLIDPYRWELAGASPVMFLRELDGETLDRAASDPATLARVDELSARLGDPSPPDGPPIAFFCTEFAVHVGVPIYSGGLGVLAGDILKEASDLGRPYLGVGLLYRQGYFQQRIDASGWQHEYWVDHDPYRWPMALVTGADGEPLTTSMTIRGRNVVSQIWRMNVGRTPLYLLDAHRPENDPVARWITSRLYVGDRQVRLEQYALLGIGGMRALGAMGIEPAVVHLNEGHAALAPLELIKHEDVPYREALERVRERVVFTTHTPIGAGNEAYIAHELLDVLGDFPAELNADVKDVLALGRAHPEDDGEPFGMTPLGLRVAGRANGVSRIHGGVARDMWKHLYPDGGVDEVPIAHVTNGVHLPTWMAPSMRALLTETLGEGWEARAAEDAIWEQIEQIPDERLWEVRNQLRDELVQDARRRATADRLGRSEPIDYALAATRAFEPDVLTIGFARRATAYKRMYLLTYDPARALRLLQGPKGLQILIAGKPHPADEEAKRLVQRLFELKWAPHVSERAAFLENYDLAMGARLVAGCDVWVNVPRAPLEACGTSGMKAALNGGLNLSVLDGWWGEAYDGTNGWAIDSHSSLDAGAQDAQDAEALYDLLENEVLPSFYDRDANGIPRAWVRRIKSSLRSIGPRFNATRMLNDYREWMYPR